MQSKIRKSLESYFLSEDRHSLDSDSINKLLSYRVIDVANFVNDVSAEVSPVAADPKTKTAVCAIFPVRCFIIGSNLPLNNVRLQRLKQWTNILKACERHLKNLPEQQSIGSSDIQLYTSLCQTLSKLRGHVILSNFWKAAFHIRYLLKVLLRY